MNFKEYDNFIEKNKYNMPAFEIYYNLTCYNKNLVQSLSENEKIKLINFIYKAYLKDENYTDLGHICDKAIENKEKILNNNFTVWNLLEVCYEQIC